MSLEGKYNDKTVTVVGYGPLGEMMTSGFESLGVGNLKICKKEDSLRDFISISDYLFFAVGADQIVPMLDSVDDLLTPDGPAISDGASVKTSLILPYEKLDLRGVSVGSSHYGAVPRHPGPGTRAWVCSVGPHSGRAVELAKDLFIYKGCAVEEIDIREHWKVEREQWFTHAIGQVSLGASRHSRTPLKESDRFSTLATDLYNMARAREGGQLAKIIEEILHTQPDKEAYLEDIKAAVRELEEGLRERDKLADFIQKNKDFHDQEGFLDSMFRRAGVIGARIANLRMYSLSVRIWNDAPGVLEKILRVFRRRKVNLRAVDSLQGVITEEEKGLGINPEKIIDFDFGVDPKTITPGIDAEIRKELEQKGYKTSCNQ